MKRAFLLASMLIANVGLSDLLPALAAADGASRFSLSAGDAAQSLAPKIASAVLVKKTLTVSGENFAMGAKLLVNGAVVKKSFNDEGEPETRLIVNKANKRLPFEEVVTLQVQNPDGQISEGFGAFTGTTFTAHNTRHGFPAFIQAGRKFLVHFDDPGVGWTCYMCPGANYPRVEFVAHVDDLIPGSQGLYLARQPGYAPFILEAYPIGDVPFRYLVNLTIE